MMVMMIARTPSLNASSRPLPMPGPRTARPAPPAAPARPAAAVAPALQPDGKIVLAGSTTAGADVFALARLNPGGSPDAAFGSGGVVTTAFPTGYSQARAVLVQPDGKVVAAGLAQGGGAD